MKKKCNRVNFTFELSQTKSGPFKSAWIYLNSNCNAIDKRPFWYKKLR